MHEKLYLYSINAFNRSSNKIVTRFVLLAKCCNCCCLNDQTLKIFATQFSCCYVKKFLSGESFDLPGFSGFKSDYIAAFIYIKIPANMRFFDRIC